MRPGRRSPIPALAVRQAAFRRRPRGPESERAQKFIQLAPTYTHRLTSGADLRALMGAATSAAGLISSADPQTHDTVSFMGVQDGLLADGWHIVEAGVGGVPQLAPGLGVRYGVRPSPDVDRHLGFMVTIGFGCAQLERVVITGPSQHWLDAFQ